MSQQRKYHLHRVITDKKIRPYVMWRDGGYYIRCDDYLNLKRKEIIYIDSFSYCWKIIVPYDKFWCPVILSPQSKVYKCEVSYG